MEGVKKDGSRIWLSVVARVIQWKGKAAIQTAVSDITDKKRTQDELVARKLESVGALAKGIAGEFNTIFSTMLSSISLAKMESYAMGFDRISEILADAEQTSDKAKDLIQQLLVLSRGGSPAKERITVEEIIRDTFPFSGRGKVVPMKREKIDFKLVLPGNLHPVSADRVQMKHVFTSLIGNGMQSMPFGGTLAVSAENVDIKPGARGIHLQPGQYVKISIKDQGQGIPHSSLANLFDPYFSTDKNGGGLELSSAFSIVKAHEGTITVHSRMGKGTRLAVFLPAIV
jgi:signal transduction histidine kinase